MRTVPALERLYTGDFELLTRHHLVEIRPGTSVVRPSQSEKTREVKADTVVLITPNEPMRGLYDELRDKHGKIWLVGDALSPRDLQIAIAEGHRTMRAFA
jgi:hypothetical protein